MAWSFCPESSSPKSRFFSHLEIFPKLEVGAQLASSHSGWGGVGPEKKTGEINMEKATSSQHKRSGIGVVVALAVLFLSSLVSAQNGVAPAGNGTGPVLTFTPGMTSTVAGNGTNGYGGDGGPALAAQLNFPMGMARDSAGNLYIADFSNSAVRKLATDGTITTVAGNGTYGYSGDGGPATSAQLSFPSAVALDGAGNLYIADFLNSCVRKVDVKGTISTFATGFLVRGVTADSAGNVYYSSWSEGVWKVDSQGVTTRIAGNGTCGFGGDGGLAINAQTAGVAGLALDSQGNLYMAEVPNSDIRKVDTNGIITTVAGNQKFGYSGDGGPATSAQFNGPTDVRVDAAGNLYVVDSSNNRIRKVDASGTITTIAGTNYGYAGDAGLASNASFAGPNGIALAGNGDLFIGDTGNSVIREVTVDSTTLDLGTATVGQTAGPVRVLVSNAGNSDLHVSGVIASNGFAIQTTCSANSALPPGTGCSVDVSFSPLVVGSITGTVTFTDDAPGTPHVINLKGQGLAVPPPSQLAFARQFSTLSLNANLGSVPVNALDAQGNLASAFSGAVTLQLQGPAGFTPFSTQLNANAGVATFNLTAVVLKAAGTYTITASSTGLTSAQAQFTVTGAKDFAISTSPLSMTVVSGSSGTVNVTASPINGFSGTISLTCSGLPAHSTCSFLPSSVNATGNNASLPSVLTISTGVASVAAVRPPASPILLASGAGFLSIGMLGLAFVPRRQRVRESSGGRSRLVSLVLLAMILLTGMLGCQGLQSGSQSLLTPRGTYTVTLTATSASVSHSVPLTLIVQ
jgi:sugar lactone lactonase YvrE